MRDVSWAPNIGRRYHLIATACKDGCVRIFRLTDPNGTFSSKSSRPSSRSRNHSDRDIANQKLGLGGMIGNGSGLNLQVQDDVNLETQETKEMQGFKVELLSTFEDHNREVWRVEWNATGTILSSAGDDGKTRLWKADKVGNFKCMSVVSSQWKPNRCVIQILVAD